MDQENSSFVENTDNQPKTFFIKKLSFHQKSSLVIFIILALLVPLAAFAALNPTQLFKRAAEVTPPPALFGQALELSTFSSNVQISSSTSLATQFEFTVEAWVKLNPKNISDGGEHYILYKITSPDSGQEGFAIGTIRDKAFFRFKPKVASGIPTKNVYVQGKTSLDSTRWHHIAGIYSANYSYLIVDGKLDADPIKDELNEYVTPEDAPLTIGGAVIPGFGTASQFYGQIDEVRFSSIARMTQTLPLAPFTVDKYTQALWHFDGNYLDATYNENNGTAYGTVKFVTSTINPLLPTPTPIPSPIPTTIQPTVFIPSPTPTLFNKCDMGCFSNSECPSGFICWGSSIPQVIKHCRNPQCIERQDCICPSPSPNTVTPTPTNSLPRFITSKFLGGGRSGQTYSATLEGIDADKNDNLTMRIYGLPTPDLYEAGCTTSIRNDGKKLIRCKIAGVLPKITTLTKTYYLKAVLSDNKGQPINSNFQIAVRQ